MTDAIILKGLKQNNLKNITLTIPKKKIVVFTGVSGSGKSSIVFDTIAAEAARQIGETFPKYVRARMPKYPRPDCDSIENLSPSVIIDQSPMGANSRSTVGTSSEIYSALRLLFSRIGQPYAGSASFFSFNDPEGMCPKCGGLGEIADINLDAILDKSKSLNQGAIKDYVMGASWYFKNNCKSGYFDLDKPVCDYTAEEMHLLLHGTEKNVRPRVFGICTVYRQQYLNRDSENINTERSEQFVLRKPCSLCHGKRLNRIALSCWINGYSISDLCDMELTDLVKVLGEIYDPTVQDLVQGIIRSLNRMIDIGLGYLSLSRPTQSLSGGEAQRVKLVRYLGSSLTDMLYIFDEPSVGMHPRDVYRMNRLLQELRDKGNTVLVVEHDEDVIAIADEVIDVGPLAGTEGGRIVFQGSYEQLLVSGTKTGNALSALKHIPAKQEKPLEFLPIRNANLHNLKNCCVDIPLHCICVVTGVAGSGKSSLMQVFAETYKDRVVRIDQKPITATNRSTPASFMGFMDEIRKVFAKETGADAGMFSFNSLGGCKKCHGKGEIVTELAFMDPIVTTCEECGGKRYSAEALSYTYKDKTILDVLSMTAQEAEQFFDNIKIQKKIRAMNEVGLSYLTLGQPMSTLSGGERQRIKLADSLSKKGSIYLLDEPTTGLHPTDTDNLMQLFRSLLKKGNSVIIIEHNLEVMKMADYILDIGPDGGKNGGQVVFSGTPREMLSASTITAQCLQRSNSGQRFTPEEMRRLTAIREENREEEDMNGLRLNPIGRVECAEGDFRIVLCREYRDALTGLSGFSHVQVLWWFDGCDNDHDRAVMTVQKPYTKGPEILGTFATRAPARPNPIAITPCEILSVDAEKGVVHLSYIDAMEGTPVLDIKPYTPSLDRVDSAKTPQWCAHWPKSYEESGDFDWESEFNF